MLMQSTGTLNLWVWKSWLVWISWWWVLWKSPPRGTQSKLGQVEIESDCFLHNVLGSKWPNSSCLSSSFHEVIKVEATSINHNITEKIYIENIWSKRPFSFVVELTTIFKPQFYLWNKSKRIRNVKDYWN